MRPTPTALWGQSPDLILSHPVFSPGKECQSLPGQLVFSLPFQIGGNENHDDARQHIGEDVQQELLHRRNLLSETGPRPYSTKSHLHPQSISPVSDDAGDFFVPFRISYQHHVVFFSPASSILSSYAARAAEVA